VKKRTRFTEEQIIGVLKEHEAGAKAADLARKHGVSDPARTGIFVKKARAELVAAGAQWRMARSAGAALMALHLAGVVFRRQWKPPRLQAWEGPFADPNKRLQAPDVAAHRRELTRRWRERQRALKAPAAATERDDRAQPARGAGP
jgi:hypothetical protein